MTAPGRPHEVRATAAGDGTTTPLEGVLAGLRLALGAGRAAEHRTALADVTDWPAVADLAAHHRVGTLFLKGLRNAGVRIPDRAVECALMEGRRRDVLRGMRQLDAMRRVTGGLAAHGIPSLTLKGLPLGQRLYGDPFAKSSIDVDLLVPDRAFTAASRVLRRLGWRCASPNFRQTPARMRWYDAVEKEHVYVGSGTRIELHGRLLANPFLFNPTFDNLDAGALTVAIGGERFRTMGHADKLLYLACHGSWHYWQRLKWLCDIAGLLRKMDVESAEEAAVRAREWRLEDFVAVALRLCREHLQVASAEPVAAMLRDRWRVRLSVGLSRHTWTPPRAELLQLARKAMMRIVRVVIGGGVRYSLHEARGLFIRYRDFSRVDLPDRLFWLYVLVRPVLLGLRVVRRKV